MDIPNNPHYDRAFDPGVSWDTAEVPWFRFEVRNFTDRDVWALSSSFKVFAKRDSIESLVAHILKSGHLDHFMITDPASLRQRNDLHLSLLKILGWNDAPMHSQEADEIWNYVDSMYDGIKTGWKKLNTVAWNSPRGTRSTERYEFFSGGNTHWDKTW